MKYCEEYLALISAAVDNALTADERRKLMDHLAACPACREAYTQMMAMHDAFENWEEDLPGDLTGEVMKTIRREKAVSKSRKRSWLPLVAAAACCALVFIGYQGLNAENNTANDTMMADSAKSTVTETVQPSATGNTASAAADDTAKEKADVVTYTASMEDIITGESEEQLLEGVLTYFRSAPEADAVLSGEEPEDDIASAAKARQTLLILTSNETALVEWMGEYTAAQGYTSETDETTAWLITEEECRSLTTWLTESGITWEQHLVELSHPEEEDVVCVVYLPS